MNARKLFTIVLTAGLILALSGAAQGAIYEQVGGTATVPDGTYDERSGIYDGAVTYIDSADVIFEDRFYVEEASVLNMSAGVLDDWLVVEDSVVNVSGGLLSFPRLEGDAVMNMTGGYADNKFKMKGDSTLNMYDGAKIASIQNGAYDSIKINIYGGEIVGVLEVEEFAEVTMSGGTVNWIDVLPHAVDVEISGGAVGVIIIAEDSGEDSNLLISGGTVDFIAVEDGDANMQITGGTVDELELYAGGDVEISGGTVGWMYADENFNMEISGGSVDELVLADKVDVVLTGGSIGTIEGTSEWHRRGSVEILGATDLVLGEGLSVDDDGLVMGSGTLTGTWNDSTAWSTEIEQHEESEGEILLRALITWDINGSQDVTTGSSDAGATDVLALDDTFSVDNGTTTLTAGDLIWAASATGHHSVLDPVVDGVQFTDTDFWDDNSEGSPVWQILGNGTTGDSEYDNLIGSLDRTDDDIATITIEGLTSGIDYVVQVWYADSRQDDRAMTFDGINDMTLLAKDWEFGTGIFTAIGTTQELVFNSGDTGKVHISAVLVSEYIAPPPGFVADETGNWGDYTTWEPNSTAPTADAAAYVNQSFVVTVTGTGNEAYSLAIGDPFDGTVIVAPDADLTITNDVDIKDWGSLLHVQTGPGVADDGILDVGGDLNVNAGTVDVDGTVTADHLSISAVGTVQIDGTLDVNSIDSDSWAFSIGDGGRLEVGGAPGTVSGTLANLAATTVNYVAVPDAVWTIDNTGDVDVAANLYLTADQTLVKEGAGELFLNGGVTVYGEATIDVGGTDLGTIGDVTVTNLTTSSGDTFTKTGSGTLNITQDGAANYIDPNSTIVVAEGTLSIQSDGTDPLDNGWAAGAASVVFDDSADRDATPTLTITGVDIGTPTGLLVYEGFDYTADTDVDGLGTSGNGWVDDWGTTHSDTHVLDASSVTGSQNTWDGVFDSVARTGNWAGNNFTTETNNGHQYIYRELDSTVTDTFTEGTTTWISWFATGSSRLVLSDERLIDDRGKRIYDGEPAIGAGSTWNDVRTYACYWVPNATDATMSESSNDGEQLNEGGLRVIKIEWDADGGLDRISVFHFLDGVTPTEEDFTDGAVSISYDFDQTTIDTLSIGQNRFNVDEIRLGLTFEDIISGTFVGTPSLFAAIVSDADITVAAGTTGAVLEAITDFYAQFDDLTIGDGADLTATYAELLIFNDLTMGDGAELTVPGDVEFNDITTTGDEALIDGNVTVTGTVTVGTGIGELEIDDDLVMGSESSYIWEVGDVIHVYDDLELEDGWDLNIQGTYQSSLEQRHTLITYGDDLNYSAPSITAGSPNVFTDFATVGYTEPEGEVDGEVYIEGLFITGDPGELLIWDGSTEANAGQQKSSWSFRDGGENGLSHWTTDGVTRVNDVPTIDREAMTGNQVEINSGTVQVKHNVGAYSLDINGGELFIQHIRTLEILTRVTVADGAVLRIDGTLDAFAIYSEATTILGQKGILKVEGGELERVSVLRKAGNGKAKKNNDGNKEGTIDVGYDAVTATGLHIATGMNFVKQGPGKVSFTAGDYNMDSSNTIKVYAGELAMAVEGNTSPLTGADVELGGGTFTLIGGGGATLGVVESGGDVILSTDFTGRTVSDDTASNITWTTSGVADPGDLTAIEGTEEAPADMEGLFDTDDASSHFAPAINTDNKDNWSVSIPLSLTTATITIDDVTLDGDMFNGAGKFQTAPRDTDMIVEILDSAENVVATETKDTGLVKEDWVLTFFDTTESIQLDNSETWTLRIGTTNFPNTSGNNTGLDGLTLTGQSVPLPDPLDMADTHFSLVEGTSSTVDLTGVGPGGVIFGNPLPLRVHPILDLGEEPPPHTYLTLEGSVAFDDFKAGWWMWDMAYSWTTIQEWNNAHTLETEYIDWVGTDWADGVGSIKLEFRPMPEPGTMLLLGFGALAVLLKKRRRRS